ncbi:MAG TPA: methylmalonyl-CoA mutase subunit beta [Actinocrinis sp.]|nr:methylmalonyl-CoA mutase subunit beta [Actinocrinis sp.]
MTVTPEQLPLAAEFPAANREQWQRLVEGVLRKSGVQDASGDAAQEALATDLEDGLHVLPLYTAEDGAVETGYPGAPPFTRAAAPQGTALNGWDVRQRLAEPDPRRANEAALADLENGVASLWLQVGPNGLPVDGLATALDGVYLDLAPIALDAGAQFAEAAEQLLRLYADRSVAPGEAAGNLGADPLGLLAATGDDTDTDRRLTAAAGLAARCADQYPKLRALTVDALVYHDAGASAAEELGCSLATGLAYLRTLTDAGLTVDQAAAQLEFRYAATADQFLTIAKLRAARRLWARVADVCGAGPAAAAQRQHAVTSSVMMTERDPWVNMLRTTVACLAAGVGGADAVTVLPFDSAVGRPDAFARRVARNTQSILVEESHLARVIDPAGGSWYVERLTDDLARAAWARFQELERAGGQRAALGSGLVRTRLAETWARRAKALARRKEPITGVSEFPNLTERPLVREPAAGADPAAAGAGLPKVRRAQAFEALRSRSDAHLAAAGSRPKVFLAQIGSAGAHAARSSFAANLFQAGGLEPVQSPADADLADRFAQSGAAVACLCSSDAVYAEQAQATAAALKAAGARRVLLAGRPGEWEAVDGYVFTGCDAVAALTEALDESGVAA